jgi:hypothetical protein
MNYHGALEARLEDNVLWFINGARFAQWKSGAAGTGKAVLRISTITTLISVNNGSAVRLLSKT